MSTNQNPTENLILSDEEKSLMLLSLYNSKSALLSQMKIHKEKDDGPKYRLNDQRRKNINSIIEKLDGFLDPRERLAIVSQETSLKMYAWLQQNPYCWYASSYDDQISNEQVDMIVAGKFDEFWESWNEYLWSIQQYADFSDIEDKFADEFKLKRGKDFWPTDIQDIFNEGKSYDASSLLDDSLRNTRTKIAVKPLKQNGNQIEFPNYAFDKSYNRYLQSYNKKYLGIENSWDAETTYSYDVLTIIGKINLKEWLTKGRIPDFIKFGPSDFALTHNFHNGAGGLGDVEIGVERKMRAEFRNDDTDSYGVDNVFGFVSSVWNNSLNCIWS